MKMEKRIKIKNKCPMNVGSFKRKDNEKLIKFHQEIVFHSFFWSRQSDIHLQFIIKGNGLLKEFIIFS